MPGLDVIIFGSMKRLNLIKFKLNLSFPSRRMNIKKWDGKFYTWIVYNAVE